MLLDYKHVIHDRLDCCSKCQKWHAVSSSSTEGDCHRDRTAVEIADGTRPAGPVPTKYDHWCIHYLPDMRRRDEMQEDIEAAQRDVMAMIEDEIAAGRHVESMSDGWVKVTGEARRNA